jgi:IclR family acetate operon transcriptional repressor
VQPSQTAARVLEVLEAIAAHSPVGVRELARLLNAEKNAVQRAIVTLADAGWIGIAPGPTTRWELTPHIFAVAHMGHRNNDLRTRAKKELEKLRDETQETALLTLADAHNFIVADVVESPHVLNASPNIGVIASPRDSATGRAVLPFLSPEKQIALLGAAPDKGLLAQVEAARRCGYAIVVGGPIEGVTSIAAPIIEIDGRPIGAVVVAGPTDRLSVEHHTRVGALVSEAAGRLSRGAPPRR